MLTHLLVANAWRRAADLEPDFNLALQYRLKSLAVWNQSSEIAEKIEEYNNLISWCRARGFSQEADTQTVALAVMLNVEFSPIDKVGTQRSTADTSETIIIWLRGIMAN